jgi:hypothetical protein
VPEEYDPDRVAEELGKCRQRGLLGLERRTANQEPLEVPELQRLAAEYAAVRQFPDPSRAAQIRELLVAGIEECTRRERVSDAELICMLFFGTSTNGPVAQPGVLLSNAMKRFGDTERRFRERRSSVLPSFAHLLISFVAAETGKSQRTLPADIHETRHAVAAIGPAADTEHFTELLARAVKVTIIGITNGTLLPVLQEALRRKRATAGRDDAFWDSLRIVFLKKGLLHTVRDERDRNDDAASALRQREQDGFWARRLISVFLSRTRSQEWWLFDYPYQLTLTGTLAEFADGRKVVQLLIRRPEQPTFQHFYLELEDTAGKFNPVFEDIVRGSEPCDMVLPVGAPAASNAFLSSESRVQSDALQDASMANGWLPMALVITCVRQHGSIDPILQLRTTRNAAREQNRLSHLGSHILEEDRSAVRAKGLASASTYFTLGDKIPAAAAMRIIRDFTGVDPVAPLEPQIASGYLHPDKEHLFFFVFSLVLQEGLQLPREAEMHRYPLSELLAVRANQALSSAADLCSATGLPQAVWSAGAEIAAQNLYLHDHADLAEALPAVAGSPELSVTLAAELSERVVEVTAPSWAARGTEIPVLGLAGWQYRQFFSDLLPLYERIGVSGAADVLAAVRADPRKSAAKERLAKLYQDEHLIARLPMEL